MRNIRSTAENPAKRRDASAPRRRARGHLRHSGKLHRRGLIAASITDIPGASSVFWGGIVSYDNRVKHRVLGVKEQTLRDFGAVCAQTAEEMAKGALCVLGTTFAVSVTGIAGPGGGTPEKPVGLVYLAAASKSGEVFCQTEGISRQSDGDPAANGRRGTGVAALCRRKRPKSGTIWLPSVILWKTLWKLLKITNIST